MIIIEKAFSKINLHLEVGNKNSSTNMHDLYATFNFLEFCDFLKIKILKVNDSSSGTNIEVNFSKKLIDHFNKQKRNISDFSKDIASENSLLEKSIKLFFSTYDIKSNNYLIEIDILKCIPDMAGLGGGSADAAAILRALSFYFKTPDTIIKNICKQIGSDIYPCYLHKSLLETTIGSKSDYETFDLTSKNRYVVLLLKPPESTNTKLAYNSLKRAYGEGCSFKLGKTEVLIEIEKLFNNTNTQTRLFNDFLESNIASIPSLNLAIECCKKNNSIYTSISGSGSCLFSLFKNVDQAQICSFEIDQIFNKTWWKTITFFR